MGRLFLPILILSIGVGWLTIQTPAESPQSSKAGDDPGDTAKTTRKGWDKVRDSPPPVASDKSVKIDYPIVTSACRGRTPRPSTPGP